VDLRTLLTIVVRRWVVVVPTIVVALIVGYRVMGSVETKYEAKGSVALLLPAQSQAQSPANGAPQTTAGPAAAVTANPFTNVPASLHRTAQLFASVLNGDAQKNAVERGGNSRDYRVTVDRDAPILRITATADTSKQAIATARSVIDAARQQVVLRETNRNVPEDARIDTDVLAAPTRATALHGDQIRVLLALIALSIAAVIGVALLVDDWVQSAEQDRERDRERARERERDRLAARVPLGPPPVAPTSTPAPGAPPARPAPPPAAGGPPVPVRPVPVPGLAAATRAAAARERAARDDEAHPEPARDATDVDIDLTAEEEHAAAAAKHPGRARAKPRRRSESSS
jgi:hypothetical protein